MTPGWQPLLGGSRASLASVERKLIFFVQAVTAVRYAPPPLHLYFYFVGEIDGNDLAIDHLAINRASGRLFPRATYRELRVYVPSTKQRSSRHRSSGVTAPLPNFKCAYTSPIGYHELAGRRTSIPRGNLTLITLRLITVRSVRFRISPVALATRSPAEHAAEKRKHGTQTAGWNDDDDDDDVVVERGATTKWKCKFYRGNFHGTRRVTVKFPNNVTGTDKRVKIKRGQARKRDFPTTPR